MTSLLVRIYTTKRAARLDSRTLCSFCFSFARSLSICVHSFSSKSGTPLLLDVAHCMFREAAFREFSPSPSFVLQDTSQSWSSNFESHSLVIRFASLGFPHAALLWPQRPNSCLSQTRFIRIPSASQCVPFSALATQSVCGSCIPIIPFRILPHGFQISLRGGA